MRTATEIKQVLRKQKPFLKERYGIASLGLFGSYVRDKQRPDSNVDILVDLVRPPQISLLDLIDLQNYLTDLLNLPVDIAIRTNLKKRIGQRILAEVELL